MKTLNISESMVQSLRIFLRQSPLGESEFRRIPGMGELYVSKSTESAKKEKYRYLYTLEIDGESYSFFGGITA